MTLYVGTSGWAYREWKPDFYPKELPQSNFLEYYASRLGACEINATFYRLQSEETFSRWRAAVPDRFRFAVKAHRRLTHTRRIAPEGAQKEFLGAFLRSVRLLEDKLGVVLFQFPPYRKRDDDAFRRLLDAIDGAVPVAFEFRDPSWDAPEIDELIAGARGTRCFADTTGNVPARMPAGPRAYIRMRHDRYDEAQRAGWQRLLENEAIGRDVFAFAKHEGVPADDPFAGVGLATWLSQRETDRPVRFGQESPASEAKSSVNRQPTP